MAKRKATRKLKLKPKPYNKYTVNDVVNASWDSIRAMSDNELLVFAKKAATLATNRRRNALKGLIAQDLPIPPSYRNWITETNIADKFSRDASEVQGISNYLGSEYERGFATIDMRINPAMERNELIHKIRVAGEFLDNETSTLRGWKKHLQATLTRLSEKSGVKISKNDYKAYWETYNKIVSEGRGGASLLYGNSEEVQQQLFQIANEVGSFDSRTLLQIIKQRQDIQYEERGEYDDYDEFFEYSED